jgi:hypothetical protein
MALAALTCGTQPTLPGLGNGASGALCSYPRGCYLVQKSGPNAGQCADCSGGSEHCRLYFVPTPGQPNPSDLGGYFVPAGADLAGTSLSLPSGGRPLVTDQPVLCTLYAELATVPADTAITCAAPETTCVARGPLCMANGFCVRAGTTCADGPPFTPQRRPGSSGPDTYCPYTDDVCCPGPSMNMDMDMGSGDLGRADAAPTDATIG